ncbi:MAG: Rne/Rng family ribonuclease [Lentisphaeria bacterium]|nr:Rne/Rng family ribonuclease [Lentisphaeria bacterium]
MKQIIVNSENLQTRISLLVNGKIEEYYIERQDTRRVVGSIYKGKIRNLESSLQAAFVDIGLEKNAFLHYWDMIPASKEILESDGDDEDKGIVDDEDEEFSEEEEVEASRPRRNNRNRKNRGHRNQENREEASKESFTEDISHVVETQETAENTKTGGFTQTLKRIIKQSFVKDESASPAQHSEIPTLPAEQLEGEEGKNQHHNNKRGSRNRKPKGNGSEAGRHRRKGRRTRKEFDLTEIPKRFGVNTDVVVQVTKGFIGEKGPRVTTNLSIPGRYIVLLPNSSHRGVSKRITDRRERARLRDLIAKLNIPKDIGIICRTACEGLSLEDIQSDIDQIMEKWVIGENLKKRKAPICIYQEPDLLERCIRDFLPEQIDEIVVDSKDAYKLTMIYVKRIDKKHRPRVRLYDNPRPIFEAYRLTEQIKNVFKRKVTLDSGAEVCFDETEALISIDINSGKSRGGKDHPETILNTNLEAAEEIGRQLKVRNIGGLVVVDFIDMRSRKDQMKVYRKMLEVVSKDRARSKVLPISRLGLLQMTRQREHASLQDAIYENCNYCHGRGLVKSSTTISGEIQRRLQEILRRDKNNKTSIRVTVHPRVLQRLRHEDAKILNKMEQEYGGELTFRSDDSVHQEEFIITDAITGKEI